MSSGQNTHTHPAMLNDSQACRFVQSSDTSVSLSDHCSDTISSFAMALRQMHGHKLYKFVKFGNAMLQPRFGNRHQECKL